MICHVMLSNLCISCLVIYLLSVFKWCSFRSIVFIQFIPRLFFSRPKTHVGDNFNDVKCDSHKEDYSPRADCWLKVSKLDFESF